MLFTIPPVVVVGIEFTVQGIEYWLLASIPGATDRQNLTPEGIFLLKGTFSLGWGIGGALWAYLGGYFCDGAGSYTLPFILVMANISLGLLGIWMAAPRQRRTNSPSKAG